MLALMRWFDFNKDPYGRDSFNFVAIVFHSHEPNPTEIVYVSNFISRIRIDKFVGILLLKSI